MKSNLRDRYYSLETKIELILEERIKASKIQSKHIDHLTCIKVDLCDYTELVLLDSKLRFLDKNGYSYDLYCEVNLLDLIEIIENI